MDLTITPPPGYHEVERLVWADPGCGSCDGTGIVWIDVWDRDLNEYAPLYREDTDCDCVWTPKAEVMEELDKRYRAWGSPERARDAWERVLTAIGPRRPGRWYWCGYSRAGYTVLSINYSFYNGDPSSPAWEITVRWDDGRRVTHCTPWDPSRDSCQRPTAQHTGSAPVPPELRYSSLNSASRRWWTRLLSFLQPDH